jgi:membrane protease subunit HflK
MSWNDSSGDPGDRKNGGRNGGGSRNPWDRRPESGPPDLDEIVRNLQRRIGGLFGRRGPRAPGGGSDGPAVPGLGWGVIAALLVGLWFATGVFQVGAAERAVVTRFGRFVALKDPGLNFHLPWPIESRQIVNTQEVLSFPDRTRMLTQDEALVDINLEVQYRCADPVKYAFQVVDPKQTLGEVAESAIREIIGRSTLDKVLETGRQNISVRTKELIQRTLDGYNAGLEVISVNLQDVSVPEQVAPAQKDAIKAREDKEAARVQAERYANEILPKARGTAEQRMLDAEAYRAQIVADADGESSRFAQVAAQYEKAPNVTRQRIYYETMESVLGGANKILLDGKAGNMVYLPLDKLLEKTHPTVVPAQPATTLPEVTVTPSRPATDDGERGRARGGR